MSLTAQQKGDLRKNVVLKTLSHVGEEETPRYSNRGDLVDRCNAYVGNDPASEAPWCLAHAVYCVGMAALAMGLHLSDTLIEKSGYCPEEYDHAGRLGTRIDPHAVVRGEAEVLPGDLLLVFYDSEGGGTEPHHAGLVIVPPSKGNPAFVSVEGNTVPDGYQAPAGREREGFGVFRKRRSAADANPSGHSKYVFVRLV